MQPTLLLVEPQSIIREPLAEALRARGYLVLDVSDAEEALEAQAGCAVSGIVSALPLPGNRGVAMLEQIAVDGALPVPVVLLADAAVGDATTQAEALGVREVVSREAFTMRGLMDRLAALVPVGEPATPPAPPPTGQAERPTPGAPAARLHPAEKPGPARPMLMPPPQIDETEVLKTLKPLITRAQLDELAESADRLRIDPHAAAAVLALLDSGEGDLQARVQAVSLDPAMALRVIARANADLGRHREPAESLHQAVDRVGSEGLRAIAAPEEAGALSDQRLDDPRCLVPSAFRDHGHTAGLIAAEAARQRGGSAEDAHTAYTAGLLHDIGRLIYARRLPEEYAETLEAAAGLGLSMDRVEQQMMLEDHAEFMDKALRHLRFGPRLLNAIVCHHMPPTQARNLAGKYMGEIATVVMADRMATALTAGEPRGEPLAGAEHFLMALKLNPARFSRALQTLRGRLRDDRAAYAEALGREPDRPQAQRLAAQLHGPAHPLFVGTDPLTDVFALFADTLCPPVQGASPTFALVRMTNVRERDALSGKLRGLEFERGVGRLPLLVVSPKGNLMLDEGVMASRPVALLAEPVAPPKLVQALNKLLEHAPTPLAA